MTTPPVPSAKPRRRHLALRLGVIAGLVLTTALLAWFVFRVAALRSRHATGPAWSFPSRVYCDGLPLTAGRPLPLEYLHAELAARGYQIAVAPLARPGTYADSPDGCEILLRGFLDAPDPEGHGGPERVRLRLAGGRLVAVERLGGLAGAPVPDTARPPRLEPVRVASLMDSTRVYRTWVPLSRIPQVLRDAVIAAEDRRFRIHRGIDLKSSFRALVRNVQAGGVRQGGSTITQQLARGLFLGSERTLPRKLVEIPLALGLELLLSKDRILEMYLNSVYWGQREGGGGVAGVAEAARWYFGTPVESLDVGQAALLAGLIPAPNAFSPFHNPRLARARRDAVLNDMVATGVLDTATAARVRARPPAARQGPAQPERFPSFTSFVRDELRRLPGKAAERWELCILTTLDPVWQQEAEEELGAGVSSLERWRGRQAQPLEGAFVALEPASGRTRAVVGGRAFHPGEFNRATRALRQPGSAIKPVVYAAALDATRRGPRFSPASTLADERRSFATPEGPWTPRNDEGEYHGEVTLAKALVKSLNVATANLVEAIGPGSVAHYAERFGLGKPKPVASIGLGTHEVTLLALTDAYAAFPAGGLRRAATPIRAVLDARGKRVSAPRVPEVQVMPATTAALMTGLLEDVVIFGIAYPLRARYGFTRPAGGKTGTTNDYHDAWFVGFTPEVVAGVWIGFDTPTSLTHPAAETALPVWAGIMNRLLAGFPPTPFASDAGLELAWIDPWTGGLGGDNCPSVMRVPFLPGTAPRTPCTRDHSLDWELLFARQVADSLAAQADSTAADSSGP